MSKLPEPIFIPKLLDTTIAGLGIQFPLIIVDSNIWNWRENSLQEIRPLADNLIIDPATLRLIYKEAKENKNFKKIGYPEFEPENLYSDHTLRAEVIRICIQDQISKGANNLVAPYLYAEDTDDVKFSLNLTLISETVQYLKEEGIELPLYVMICIGNTVLQRPLLINHIIDRYNDSFEERVSGFFLRVNDIDAEVADTETLLGYAGLVFRLAEYKPTYVKSVGVFGEILSAVGASGYSCGLASGESFAIKNLQGGEDAKGGGRHHKRIYIPEIFDYINDEEAKKIGYTCNCHACQGRLIDDDKTKKLHLLYTRLAVMDEMQKMDRTQRIAYLRERLSDAMGLIQGYRDRYGASLKTAHIPKWLAVLDAASTWKGSSEEDEELSELLAEIDGLE